MDVIPDRKVQEVNMWPIWGRQEPGGPHVGPMNFAIWDKTLTNSLDQIRNQKPLFHIYACPMKTSLCFGRDEKYDTILLCILYLLVHFMEVMATCENHSVVLDRISYKNG